MDKTSLIKKFNKLTAQINACEIWFDETTTTEKQRKDMYPKLIKAHNERVDIVKQLESLGMELQQEDYWNGIKEVK